MYSNTQHIPVSAASSVGQREGGVASRKLVEQNIRCLEEFIFQLLKDGERLKIQILRRFQGD